MSLLNSDPCTISFKYGQLLGGGTLDTTLGRYIQTDQALNQPVNWEQGSSTKLDTAFW
jgi:hypothetical protein